MANRALSEALRQIPTRVSVQPSAAERVADVLREQIVNGALRSGTRLTEETIGAALGFSRNTIREAFALLIAERLAAREPNRGVFVATPTASDIRDLYATRRLIEPAALEHGIGFSHAAVARLREVVDAAHACREHEDTAGVAQGNQEFHRTVARLAESRRVDQLMEGVLAEMRLVFHLMGDDPGFHVPYLDRNEAIIRDLEAGDRAGAAAALRAYLSDAEEHLLGALHHP
ncbi:GntR family transcriptional regulator [Humibacillus xanthopallidus]|uniref:DNA-binding GntR family transcriptional regulator n=1 Tax=Humibacillus xanthopallidus TaxID=412689 RepID=A0A543I330_9MICO|nr:GntR family transcriptional regulator [Humibacillus xanthopallidus]TQM65006.1 DNA-binding GntR family transcriptional regulator [Humibacillus xanthopallidus]